MHRARGGLRARQSNQPTEALNTVAEHRSGTQDYPYGTENAIKGGLQANECQ